MAVADRSKGKRTRALSKEAKKGERGHRWRRPEWAKPGVLVFLSALALALAGWVLVLREGQRIPVQEASIDGLAVHLDEASWVRDQMDHGENFQMPTTMMPDMPEWGKQRVSFNVAFYNHSKKVQVIDAAEFYLVPEKGNELPPVGAQLGRAPLAPGQALNTAIYFDLDTTRPHGKIKVAWRRRGEEIYFPVPEPAEHYHLRPIGGEVAFPPDARLLLPLGDVARGRDLYMNVFGCSACHGDPQVPGSNNVGPHLAHIGTVGGTREKGVPAAQYIYQSILDPNAFIAPECKAGPCAEPSAMPEFASLMKLQDMADLVSYVASLKE